jgi:hypothetical protein
LHDGAYDLGQRHAGGIGWFWNIFRLGQAKSCRAARFQRENDDRLP